MLSEELVSDMTREELLEEIQKLKNEIAAMKEWERSLEISRNFREGQIEGLKFALRCNSVNGGNVK